MNKYTQIARVYPAVLTGIPIVLICIPIVNGFLEIIDANQWIGKTTGNIAFSIVILYFYSQAVRFLGKFVFEKIYFRNELKFPTTEMLHPQSRIFSEDMKKKLRQKISDEFKIDLDSAQEDDELRRMINDSVAKIRLKVGSGKLLLQHNIEYGFTRNLCGGSVFGLFCSLVGVAIYWMAMPLFSIFLGLTAIYLIIIVFSKPLISLFGFQYGKVLLTEYMEL